jgi:hypothetical protein
MKHQGDNHDIQYICTLYFSEIERLVHLVDGRSTKRLMLESSSRGYSISSQQIAIYQLPSSFRLLNRTCVSSKIIPITGILLFNKCLEQKRLYI